MDRSRVRGKVLVASFLPRRSRTTASPGEGSESMEAPDEIGGPMLWAAYNRPWRGPVGCNPPIDPPGVHGRGQGRREDPCAPPRGGRNAHRPRDRGDLRRGHRVQTTLTRRLSPTSASTCASTIWPRSTLSSSAGGDPRGPAVRPQARRPACGAGVGRPTSSTPFRWVSTCCSTGRSVLRPTTPLAGRCCR